MTNTFTLANLVSETKKRFEPVTIEVDEDTVITLPSILKLGKKDREAVTEILSDLGDMDDEDESEEATLLVVSTIGDLFTRISPKSRRLLKALEDEDPEVQLYTLTQILNAWFERTQPGEA